MIESIQELYFVDTTKAFDQVELKDELDILHQNKLPKKSENK